jgi:DNA-binding transcriptional LysR family regulator
MHKIQPAISQSIKRLEQNLGFSIVDRDSYRLKLTEQGKHFYLEASKLLAIRDDLKILANEFAEGNEAKFSILLRAYFLSSYLQ